MSWTKINQSNQINKISVRYIGKLTDSKGKTFDSNVKGQPFTFTLGKGEVISGWDLGFEGFFFLFFLFLSFHFLKG